MKLLACVLLPIPRLLPQLVHVSTQYSRAAVRQCSQYGKRKTFFFLARLVLPIPRLLPLQVT